MHAGLGRGDVGAGSDDDLLAAHVRELTRLAVIGERRRVAGGELQGALRLLVESDVQADWKTAGSNAVLGGIAASDAICGAVLGEHHNGEDHREAKRLLDRATSPDTAPGVNLKRLVDEKTNYQYSSARVTLAGTRRLLQG